MLGKQIHQIVIGFSVVFFSMNLWENAKEIQLSKIEDGIKSKDFLFTSNFQKKDLYSLQLDSINVKKIQITKFDEETKNKNNLPVFSLWKKKKHPLQFVQHNSSSIKKDNSLYSSTPKKKVHQEPTFTKNKLHKYLGLGSLLLAVATVFTIPDDDDNPGIHQQLAIGAAALGVGAVATGFMYHYDDIRSENGITDPDNMHMALGILGTVGYLVALSSAPKDIHAVAGAVGAISMGATIYLTW